MHKVSVVEDDFLIGLDPEIAPEEAGHFVVGVATTGAEAVTFAERHAPDVIGVDMPLADGSRGPDAVEEVRSKGEVVFASGNPDRATRARLDRFDPLASPPCHVRTPKKIAASIFIPSSRTAIHFVFNASEICCGSYLPPSRSH